MQKQIPSRKKSKTLQNIHKYYILDIRKSRTYRRQLSLTSPGFSYAKHASVKDIPYFTLPFTYPSMAPSINSCPFSLGCIPSSHI